MKFRISLLIPALLAISALLTSTLMFVQDMRSVGKTIRRTHLDDVNLSVTQLQNILYNRLTEGNMAEAKLNLSIAAMRPSIEILALVDEGGMVLMANRYAWEHGTAARVPGFDETRANRAKDTNQRQVSYGGADDTVLSGYYPVVLQLEGERGGGKKVGVLFVRSSVASRLRQERYDSAVQSALYGASMLAASLLVALLLHQVVSRRLRKLMQASNALAAGNLDARAELAGNDELAELGGSFDDMAARIKQDIQRRESAEKELRELNESLESRVAERTRELRETSELNERMLSASSIGIAAYAATGECAFANAALAGMIGATEAQARAQNFRQLVPWRKHGLCEIADRVLEMGRPEVHEFQLVTTFGRPISFDCFFARFMRGGRPHLLAMMSDITTRKAAEAELLSAKDEAERANRAKSEFLARMSHELRTPMNAILGFSQVLELEPLQPQYMEYVHEIHGAGDHLLDLINELLDLARIEAGKLAVAVKPVPLKVSMAEALIIVQSSLATMDVHVVDKCAGETTVLADAMRLKQVLVNLLSNAVKYNNRGGRIVVDCQPLPDAWVRISVADSGPGIPPEKMARLFQPFDRLDAEAGTVEGTGIGLALSKQLAELMGGRVGAESQPGRGSTFWIDLPLAQMPGAAEAHAEVLQPRTDAAAGVITMLYVEDNAANLRLVQAMLRQHPQLKLLSATRAETGLQLASLHRPNLILLDIHLPEMDGYAMLGILQSEPATRGIPVLALSADAMPADIERGLAAGFRDYLTKPVKQEALIAAIRSAVEATRPGIL